MGLPEDNNLILVAIMPSPRDLEIAKVLGWYRIPLRKAPKVISVDYLAFYQPQSFGFRGGQIMYVASVLGHELTVRKELLNDERDHPRANEEYYKIQIGPLQKLPNPIPAISWRRVTFLYTTGEYLRNAKSVNDLVVQETDRKALWQALRERAEVSAIYKVNGDLDRIDPDILQYLGLILAPRQNSSESEFDDL